MSLTFESTIQGPTLYARRKDDRVLCVDKDCGFPLAWILQPKAQWLEKEPFVWFPPGWVWQRDGTWTVAAGAKRRLRGDRLHPQGQTAQAKHVLYGHQVEGPTGWVPYLPAVAWCPKCPQGQGRQTLDVVRLGVGDITDAVSRMKSPCGFPGCPRLVEKKVKDGLIVTPTYCPEHEGKMSGLSSADRHQAGYPRRLYRVETGSLRILAFPDELERWKREPLRFQ